MLALIQTVTGETHKAVSKLIKSDLRFPFHSRAPLFNFLDPQFMIDFLARVFCIRDIIVEKENVAVVSGQPKKRWNAGRVGGDSSRPQYPYTDISVAQVRG